MRDVIANCVRTSSAPTSAVKQSCSPGSLPVRAAEACRNGDVSNSPTSKMPTCEKAGGMKAARIVRRKTASARSIWISTSTFASGGNSPPLSGAICRCSCAPCVPRLPCEREVICPTGRPAKKLSSPICKNISLHPSGKSSLQVRAIPPHQRGVSRSSRTRDGVRWTRQRFACDGIAGRVERLLSDHRHADERRLQRTAKSCGPDAPTLASSLRSGVGPTGLRQNISAGDGGKQPGHRGEYDISVCRGKARFLRGCKSLPARVAPAGSNRSSREGNDPAEASDVKGHQVTPRVCGL